MVPVPTYRETWKLANTVQKNTKPPGQYGYRLKLILDPETQKMECKATLVCVDRRWKW